MDKEVIANLVRDIVATQNIRIDEPMKEHTSFKVGGPADVLVMPDSAEQVAEIIRTCNAHKIPFFTMGNGSNLIVRDKGVRGVVIKIFKNLSKCNIYDDIIQSEAGALLSKVANVALEHGLAGLEFASGIPGTLGGAVVMNAGAYGGEMKDVIVKTQYVDRNGDIKEITGDSHEFGYRSSFVQREGGIVLKSELKLKKGDRLTIKSLMNDLNKRRKDKQPLEMPSAGSTFKRPEGYFAGKLIEDCDLRGYRIGGAEVSCKHCGFIVNAENATADDIISLIRYVQTSVKGKFGVELQTEVKIVGEI